MKKSILQKETVLTNMGGYFKEKTLCITRDAEIKKWWYVSIVGEANECYATYEEALNRFNARLLSLKS